MKKQRTLEATTKVGDIYTDAAGRYELEPMCGTSIDRVCQTACLWAQINRKMIALKFNDIELVATPETQAADLHQAYHDESERRHREYIASPKGIRAAQEAAANTIKQQARVDEVVKNLPGAIASPRMTLGLLCQLADAALTTTTCDYGKLADVLETAWVANAHVGKSPEEIKADRSVMAEYIVGQAIACLRRNMPPHPIIEKFTEEWRQLGKTPATAN